MRVKANEGFAVSRDGGEVVALDRAQAVGLLRRGLVRDVIRQIQELRKSSGLELADRIMLTVEGLEDLTEDDLSLIANEVLALSVARGPGRGGGAVLELEDRAPATAWLEKA